MIHCALRGANSARSANGAMKNARGGAKARRGSGATSEIHGYAPQKAPSRIVLSQAAERETNRKDRARKGSDGGGKAQEADELSGA
eukprot:6675975-Pyramimonas_sp.AAC.2